MPEITTNSPFNDNLQHSPSQNSVADTIIYYLEAIGVKYTFGIPGGAIEPILNALAKSTRRKGIRHINSCHESAAAYMADGYHRETGELGVCIATSGPGATNLITGVSCAYDNNIPMLALTGQPAIPSFGKSALQESSDTGVNIMGMFEHCTHYNSLISHPDQLPHKLTSALLCAIQTKGPVHLSIPVDILRQPLSHHPPTLNLSDKLYRTFTGFDIEQANKLITLLVDAHKTSKPVFFIGSGAGEAIDNIIRLAEKTGALFVTTPDAKGLINPMHSAYRGVFGFGGHDSATDCIKNSQHITIAFGTGFDELSSNGWSEDLLNTSLVHIDEIDNNFLNSPMAMLHIYGHIATVSKYLCDNLKTNPTSTTEQSTLISEYFSPYVTLENLDKYYSDDTPIKPQRLMKELSESFPSNTRFLADAGNCMLWAPHYLQPPNKACKDFSTTPHRPYPKNTSWLRLALKFAPMGWAIGASIGVSISSPNHPTVCITGDGAYLMCGQEITTAIQQKLPVIFVILNDSAYGMVMHGQRLANAEKTAFELHTVDFAKQAESLGIDGFTIRSPEDFNRLDIKQILSKKGPCILDVRIDREEVPPMKTRLKTLGTLQKE